MERIRRTAKPGSAKRGFTLVELLVVIAIVLLVAIVAIPAINASLGGHQVTDAARIFTGGLAGARDSAIRANKPAGIRLLPDPVLAIPAPGFVNSGTTQLVYNRFIPIEPAGNYSEGRVSIGPQYYATGTPAGFPPSYNAPDGGSYPFPFLETPGISQVLMIEESPYAGGFACALPQPNAPTNWYWNVRVGDQVRLQGSGRPYTIVGPCVVNPAGTGTNQGNPEMFVNVGPPGSVVPLHRQYYPLPATATPATLKPFADARPEFLFLVNGGDDDGDGYVDEGFDGANQNPPEPGGAPDATHNLLIDESAEWETETWAGTGMDSTLRDFPTNTPAGSPSADWIYAHFGNATVDIPYTIERRPTPKQGARETMLPVGTVIDATTWNTANPERSRLPISPWSLYCDVLVDPNGRYVPTTVYSTPTSVSAVPFLHFWLCSRDEVNPIGSVPTSAGFPFLLPMTTTAMSADASGNIVVPTSDGQYYPGANPTLPVLKGDRRLVTMFAQTGLVVTNTIESVPPPSGIQPGEGFNVKNVNYPFLRAQLGNREAR